MARMIMSSAMVVAVMRPVVATPAVRRRLANGNRNVHHTASADDLSGYLPAHDAVAESFQECLMIRHGLSVKANKNVADHE